MACVNYYVIDMDTLNNNPLVSILVSCYNVEQFIESFFINIAEQIYQNYELIIVNDGSTDNTLNLLNHFSGKFNNIKIISHAHNMGLGAGRNTGLKNASGKYVYFCDVDDYIKPNLLQDCVAYMESGGYDFLVFGFDVKYPGSKINNETVRFKHMQLNSRKEIRDHYVDNLLLSRHGNGFVWNKFYRRTFIENNRLRFGTQKIQQDEVFNIKAILAASNLVLLPDTLYVYNIFTSGNNRSRYIPERFEIFIDIRNNFEFLLKKWDLKDERVEDFINRRFWGNIMNCLQYDLLHKDCRLTYKDKRHRFILIVNHPYSLMSRSFLKHHKNRIDFRTKMYLMSLNCYEIFRAINGLNTISTKLYTAIKK